MKTVLFVPALHVSASSPSSLSDIVDKVCSSLEPAASGRRCFILNDIPGEIDVHADHELLASVMGSLVREVVMHTENGCVRITAKVYNEVVLIHVKNDGSLHYDTVFPNLEKIQRQSERLGGFVGFTSYRNKVTTIAFSFVNKRNYCPKPGIAREETFVLS
jgi:hypothetical protein